MVKNSIDGCDTSLVLGLGSTKRSLPLQDLHHRSNPSFKQEPSISIPSPIEPRFTHGCQDDGYGSRNFSPDVRSLVQQQSSSLTTVSSFSNKPTSKEVNEDEEGSLRKKLRLTKEQSSFLEERFKEHTTLNPKQKQALANQLNLRPRQVEVWFQNRRARTKMKQNEAEVELFRRYFETLADENRQLKKELQELKTTKLSPPWFATLCPKCERAAMGVDGSKSGNFKSTVAMGKHQLFNHFAHSSAT